ncbi:hypothetical protein ACWT_6033 [Actinoplanes sp. SE50]|uniref:hypothetical protein n=1 Tax=unclassified Actinoplanes TaxID=2626549 RepID=UPI00023EC854|nr:MULTISPECIES: hypothetical protein [unclassified Actinoplanes]AEV87050.1 hypothetical protein ACPL_6165 [Actinoplanes sp. SE50/110]ATO85448.1 hypothetical protein ACWT_6033 [Actinoplanes sp. SE50]SLM02860.1 hypothetical protein ACSP50_6145 [Actinoplanes sp. SE50/110]
MKSADWALIISAAALLISLGGTAAAIWQARIARHAAEISGRAADASSAQAIAAIQQTNVLRRQLSAEDDDRALRDAPEFVIEFVGEGEWGTWRTDRRGGRRFAAISRHNNPSVHDWVKRRQLVLGHRRGPAVRTSIAVDGRQPPDAELLDPGPFDMVEGASRRIPIVTVHALEGAELTVVITSEELSGQGRRWVSRRVLAL